MNKVDVFDIFASGFSSSWKHHCLQGMLLIAFGLVILFFPQLLVAMIASFFIIAGATFLGLAWSLRRFSRRYSDFRGEIFDLF